MKKAIFIVIVLAIAFTLAVSLTACKTEEKTISTPVEDVNSVEVVEDDAILMTACKTEEKTISTPVEDVNSVEAFIEVVKDDVQYLVSSDLSKAFIWNSVHSYFPDMEISYETTQEIPAALFENAENYFNVTEE